VDWFENRLAYSGCQGDGPAVDLAAEDVPLYFAHSICGFQSDAAFYCRI
jgi:hypothetical protein